MAFVLAHQCLVTMVAVLEQEATVPKFRQHGRRFPAVFEVLLHRFDVLFPFVGGNPNEHVGFRPGEPHEVAERHGDGPDPPMWSLRQCGGEHDVVAAPTRDEVADPDRGATRAAAARADSKLKRLTPSCLPIARAVRSSGRPSGRATRDADVVDGAVVFMKS